MKEVVFVIGVFSGFGLLMVQVFVCVGYMVYVLMCESVGCNVLCVVVVVVYV